MSFEEAVAYLDGLGTDVMKSKRPSTTSIEAICEALNYPERAVDAIHVTGTNGKTSTARIAAAVLTATGLSVGTYTSPHLQSIQERIALSGKPLDEATFGEVFAHLRPYLEVVEKTLGETLTYFEVLTAMFFLWAAEHVDAAVVEVGLGGSWDATNVVSGTVAVITNVGFDHTGLLGTDKETIAGEKAGIIKPGSVLVTGERSPSVLSVLTSKAESVGVSQSVLERDFGVTEDRLAIGGRYFSLKTSVQEYEGLFLPLHGSHQAVNAALAIEAVSRFLPARTLDRELAQQGLAAVEAPGRLETIRPGETPGPVVLDVAHNPDGISALVTSLAEAFAFESVRFVIGILADKDYEGMLVELARVPCSLVLTRPHSMRSVPPGELEGKAEHLGMSCEVIEDVASAVDAAVGAMTAAELVCITGSHYVVGEARSHLMAGGDR